MSSRTLSDIGTALLSYTSQHPPPILAPSSRRICIFCLHHRAPASRRPPTRRFLHFSAKRKQSSQPSFSDPELSPPPQPSAPPPPPTQSLPSRRNERAAPRFSRDKQWSFGRDQSNPAQELSSRGQPRQSGGRSGPTITRIQSDFGGQSKEHGLDQRSQNPAERNSRFGEGSRGPHEARRRDSNTGEGQGSTPFRFSRADIQPQARQDGGYVGFNRRTSDRQTREPLEPEFGRPPPRRQPPQVSSDAEEKPRFRREFVARPASGETSTFGRSGLGRREAQEQQDGPSFKFSRSNGAPSPSSDRSRGAYAALDSVDRRPERRKRYQEPTSSVFDEIIADRSHRASATAKEGEQPPSRQKSSQILAEQTRSERRTTDRPRRDEATNRDKGRPKQEQRSQDAAPAFAEDFDLNMDQDEDPRARRRSKKSSHTQDELPKRRLKDDKASRRAEKFAAAEEDFDAEAAAIEALRVERERKKKERREKRVAAKAELQGKRLELPPFISIGNLATTLKVRAEVFTEKLTELGFGETDNEHVLNFENASLIAQEYGYEPSIDRSEAEDLRPRPPPTDMTVLPPRPPVVTIMGHVDHGKTTLLDFLRKSSVAANEHGGITQHIGAFSVPVSEALTSANPDSSINIITFLDTPGHSAFLSMRQRGANVTDIVILVVAADDSVKPQTIEAIRHARAAKVPIIVAINKVDKDEADIERVKQDLLVQDIEVEDFGGDIQAIPVSGKTGEGLDKLEEAIVTQAEILDMRAETDGSAEGWVLEATTKRAGRVATVLVRRGTLKQGDVIVAGTSWARVRTLKNEAGALVGSAGPGTPVEIDGWRDQPDAGDEVLQTPGNSEQKATDVVEFRLSRLEADQAAKDMEAINSYRRRESDRQEAEKLAKEEARQRARDAGERFRDRGKSLSNAEIDISGVAEARQQGHTDLFFIVKADVSGSAEAIEDALLQIPLANQPVTIHILRVGVGPVSEFDVDHISAVPDGQGFIVSFNQEIPNSIAGEAEAAGAKILDQNIIYKVIDEVKALVEDKLPPIVSKRVTGDAEVAAAFDINIDKRKFQKVAGCKVRNGGVTKSGRVTIYRGTVGDEKSIVYDGVVSTLKSQKKDVQEMRKGTECGMSFEGWEDFKIGDIVQSYEEKREKRRLL